ncbi:Cof-type HAD-IIB family hydrolase [Companilactobacillus ginsenosidimutans]|uniref:Hydrolase n=1 Tax=Companilactobacillus ginsenosidimutans TaxID=1007676 RepID=A0A0H4QG58_9LACO|nr:Cof-type HAD-IIB family hydrolase [Companilactobacillus ginsenosidimutans]AKP66912.1 hydrolase [Companilactobacillus ginsenosidimutans]
MPVGLVLSDIDGTILDDKNFIDPKLPAKLLRLRKMKIPFVLSSARSPEGMYPIAKKLGILDNPIACYNGAYVINGLKEKNSTVISSHEVKISELTEIFKILNQGYPTVSVNTYSEWKWYVNQPDKWTELESGITNLEPAVTDLHKFIQKHPVHKLLLIDSKKVIADLRNTLENVNFAHTSFILSKDNYLEVTNKKASKKEALKDLAQYYKVPIENTMTLGDNFNDVPMFKASGLGVAMANAPEKVQGIADKVTLSNNDSGVTAALREYI